MARSRNIKPSLFKNELLGVDECDPLVTILFESLWCLADREGRLEDRPLRIKGETFPYRTMSLDIFNGYLTELERLGFIWRYTAGNLPIIQIVTFSIHQSPHKTEKASKLPEPPAYFFETQEVTDLTVNAPLFDGEGLGLKRSDSFNRIPDSLIDDSCTSTDSDESLGDSSVQKLDSRKELAEKIDVVFAYWQTILKKERHTLTDQRKKAIAARLKKYSVEQILRAIDGCACSPHHMGVNDTGTEYNDIELICRNDTKLEGFIEKAEKRVNGNGTGKQLNSNGAKPTPGERIANRPYRH